MLKADAEKIKSAPKFTPQQKKILLYGFGVSLALFAVVAPTLFYQPQTADLQVDGRTLSLEIASSQVAQDKGLGGRKNMASDKGMLFVFARPVPTCLWMKGMEFPLDMIWLNSTKQVVYIRQDVSPSTYPEHFCPPSAAKYIIEINAGQVQALGIRPDQILHFN